MRYKVEKSTKAGWWVATDLQTGLVLKWEDHRLNDTQQVTFLYDDKTVIDNLGAEGISKVLQEIGYWLFTHHYSKAFETPVHEMRLSEDDKELRLIRHKEPQFTILIQSDASPEKIGAAIKKAGEFLIKYKRKYS
ncbi:MAG: hypothetical protein RR382_01850 [Tannerellaceae bacterium]